MSAHLEDPATSRHLAIIPALAGLTLAVAWLALADWFVLVLPVLALCLAALHSSVRAGYHKTDHPDLAKTGLRYGLSISLTQAGLYAALFAWLAHYFLSFPNRDAGLAAVQVWAVIGMAFHLHYINRVHSTGLLPRRIWPMHLSAVVIGGFLGTVYVLAQTNAAQTLHQERQQPLVDAISAAPDPCGAFKQYRREHPQEGREAPEMYHGAVENVYGGNPQFVLAYRAMTNFENLIVYYYSGSRKWIVTYLSNTAGMDEFKKKIEPLGRCAVR